MREHLHDRQREEETAQRSAADGVEMRRLDKEAADLRRQNLRPAVLALGLAEIERERQELMARAAGKNEKQTIRARELASRLPAIMAAYRDQIRDALKILAQPEWVDEAREATRRLLVDGQITLAPNAAHNGVTGPVHFVELGDYVLQLAGMQRRARLGAVSPVVAGACYRSKQYR